MGYWYEYRPPPDEQHKRLVALRQLTSRGIPCILWGEDALDYVHSVPTSLFDQKIIVPDESLESASVVLQEGRYVPAPFTHHYYDWFGPNVGKSAFPRGIFLKHLDIPDDEPYKLELLPGYILLLPQSYYGFDVRSKERFQSLVPPLDVSNGDILTPKFHTFLEGLVVFRLNPPVPHETPHITGWLRNETFMEYLMRYRVKYEDDGDAPPPQELLPEERVILSELQTEDARWYMGVYLSERRFLTMKEIIEYNRRKSSVSCVPYLLPEQLSLNARQSLSSAVARNLSGSSLPSLRSDTRRSCSTFCATTQQPDEFVTYPPSIAVSPLSPVMRVPKPALQSRLGRRMVTSVQLLSRRRFL